MKVLFFVAEDWYFCSHRLSHALALKAIGHEIIVLTQVSSYGEIITNSGLKLVNINFYRHGLNPLREIRVLYSIWRIYKKYKPDIIHHVALKPVIYGSIIAMIMGHQKVINAIAGMGFLYISKSLKAKFLKFIVRHAFKILFNRPKCKLIVQNKDDFDYFLNKILICPNKIKLIKGVGVNTEIFSPVHSKNNKQIVMMASRLLWSKGVGEFYEAAKMLKSQGFDARFVFVGDGDINNPENVSNNQIKKWELSGNVEFWGHQSDMAATIGKADILCLPSYREGMPKILLEGASCGKPIVASNVPGCREIVQEGVNGLLVPVQNINKLAMAIKQLLKSPKLRESMGGNGRNIAKELFDEKIIINETLQLYEEINKKKLLYFIAEDWYFYSHRLDLALAARKKGYDVCLVTNFTSYKDIIQKHGISTVPLKISRMSMNPIKELITFIKILKIYNFEKPDIVHHVALKPVLYGSLASMLNGRPHLINAIAGMGYIFSSDKKSTKFLRFLIKKAFKMMLNQKNSDLILQNPNDINFFIQNKLVKKKSITLIRGSGVDINKYIPDKNKLNTPIVLLASRLIWDKGIGDFVKAANILKGIVDARFVIVGDIDNENPSAIPLKVINQWHECGDIEWWGYKTEMETVIANADIACLPSFYGEGIPKFLIESAACGLPIVTTDWPGCKEIVKHGVNGLLVPIKKPELLAESLKKLIQDPELRNLMGLKGREMVKSDFTIERVVDQTLDLYNKKMISDI
jgi:glycosyltransferase involved in cell wall biosynthesis